MFRLLLACMTLSASVHCFAQISTGSYSTTDQTHSYQLPKTGFEEIQMSPNAALQSNKQAAQGITCIGGTTVGATTYDLQTNGSVQHRAVINNDEIEGAWMQSLEFGGSYADRGTGYNTYNGGWDFPPSDRIESERVGWPNLLKTESGRIISITHTNDYHLLMTYKDPGDSDWTEVAIPNNTPSGILWPRAAVGGPDGDIIHVIGLTTPEAFGGVSVDGQMDALRYYRSTDNGDTWDVQDFQIPQLDATNYLGFDADMYDIHARGNRVAIAILHHWADSKVIISEDNGLNWDETRLVDFPVDLFDYDTQFLDEDGDLLADTVLSTDNTGQVYIDQALNVHVVYGSMLYLDEVQGDGSWSYFPGVSGLNYWNESYGPDNAQLIGDLIDAIPDGFFEFGTEFANYGGSNTTSMASIGEDSQGDIYVAYAGIVETHYDNFNRRHIYATKSTDGGQNWVTPVDVTPDDEFEFFEHVYPCIAEGGDDMIHILYQRDYMPGLGVLDGTTDINDIIHLPLDQNLVPQVSIQGCTDVSACNYDSTAECDDGSCTFPGCTDPSALNFSPSAGCDDGTCIYLGCDEIGNPAWAGEPQGLYPADITVMEWGVPYDGELVFNVLDQFLDEASGNIFPIIGVTITGISNLPNILSVNYPENQMPASSQHCVPLTGTPAQEGLFEVVFNTTVTVSVFGTEVDIENVEYYHYIQIDPNVNGIPGCMYAFAPNYNQFATYDDGSCLAPDLSDACGPGTVWDEILMTCVAAETCASDLDGNDIVNAADLLMFLAAFGAPCP